MMGPRLPMLDRQNPVIRFINVKESESGGYETTDLTSKGFRSDGCFLDSGNAPLPPSFLWFATWPLPLPPLARLNDRSKLSVVAQTGIT